MDDQAGRILSLEASLAETQRSLTTHDLLLRALLTHLALTEPKAFEGMISGFSQSGLYGYDPLRGQLTHEVAMTLGEMLEDVAASVAKARG